jgi:hypothetical protein
MMVASALQLVELAPAAPPGPERGRVRTSWLIAACSTWAVAPAAPPGPDHGGVRQLVDLGLQRLGAEMCLVMMVASALQLVELAPTAPPGPDRGRSRTWPVPGFSA